MYLLVVCCYIVSLPRCRCSSDIYHMTSNSSLYHCISSCCHYSLLQLVQCPTAMTIRAAASTRVLLLLEYSYLISISGCKFPFPVAVFCRLQSNSIDELLAVFKQFLRLDSLPSATRSSPLTVSYSQVRWPTTPYSSLAACIKVLPVLTSTRVLVKLLGRVLE